MTAPPETSSPAAAGSPAAAANGEERTIGLWGATGVGVGAIVGGGILVLAGAAFRATGPGAILAFAANGAIALLTALVFAELATAFPQSGGAYTYAKKVLSLRVAFAVGWVLWFAYIVAGVLYALGFAEYGAAVLVELWRAAAGEPPGWLRGRGLVRVLAVGATVAYSVSLIRQATGGRQWLTMGKVVVFAFLVVAGLVVLGRRPAGTITAGMLPLLPGGGLGLLQAMGVTFIALQGFEVIAAAAGEVREPRRVLPRAMLLSLGAALAIYLPFLFVISVVGIAPGQSIAAMSRAAPETVVAVAVRNFLGPAGYWLVMVAAILATLSALQANVLAASRVALSMARDRTLPAALAGLHPRRGTPTMAIYASALAMVVTMLMVPDLVAAGAAASLIFLISFALAHATGYLARRRAGGPGAGYRTPWFPAVPVVGGVACLAMAGFQAVAAPAAGGIVAVLLALGGFLYLALFARGAQMMDAFAEAADPELVRFRGRSPLVLVPVANPARAPALVAVAQALAPPTVGRVLLLAVIRPLEPAGTRATDGAGPDAAGAARAVALGQEVLREALTTALAAGHAPEALITVAPEPWSEIARVARSHRCESLLLGLHRLVEGFPAHADTNGTARGVPLDQLLNEVECDVTILNAESGWRLEAARRILLPIGGKGVHDELRARLLGSLCRAAPRELTFVRVLPADTTAAAYEEARRDLAGVAIHESSNSSRIVVLRDDDVVAAIAAEARGSDLVVLGLPRQGGRALLGELAARIGARLDCPTIMISRRV